MNAEEKRLEALRGYNILDTISEEEYDRVTQLAALICDVPISLVSLVEEDRQWFKSKVGVELSETPIDISFCYHAIKQDDLFEIPDATKDPRFINNELVTGEFGVRFYAGYPLVDPNGHALGSLCVIDRQPKELSESQQKALQLLARQVTDLIIERREKQEFRNFYRLFQSSDDLIGIMNENGLFEKVNPAFEKTLGWAEEYYLNHPVSELIDPDDIGRVEEDIRKLSLGAKTITTSAFVRTLFGEKKYLEFVATKENDTSKIFIIARDISEAKMQENLLRNSERRFKAFFDNSQGIICVHDLNGTILSVNKAGAATLGYEKSEMADLSLFDITSPEQHEDVRKYLFEIARSGSAKGQMLTRHKDGSPRIWDYNNILEINAGHPYVVGSAVDVTEQRLLEDNLRKTREMLEETNKVARVGGWELDLVNQTMYWSTVTKEIHGLTPDFVPDLTQGINFYKEGESRDRIRAAVGRAMERFEPWDMELQIVNAQGNDVWVRAICYVDVQDGKCVRLYGTFQDIDERKKADLELGAARKVLDEVLDAAVEVSVIATDLHGTIRVFNKGAEKLLGYSAEEMIGTGKPIVFHDQEEVIARGGELAEEYGRPFAGSEILTYKATHNEPEHREWTFIRKDGTRLMVSLVISAMRDVDGNVNGFLGIATDITKRKKMEDALITEKARLSAFVEYAPAAVAMFDTDMRYVAASNRWLEDYRLSGQNIIGQSHLEMFPHIPEPVKARYQRCLEGAVDRNDEELQQPFADTPPRYIAREMRPWYQYDGTIGGMLMSTQDISSIIEQRELLKKAKTMAEQASIAKSEFLANMSHEIRTPLNGVIGFTDLVMKTSLTDTQMQYLSIVSQSGNALLAIINDILDFSKIEAGKLELDIQRADIFDLCSQAADIISYQVQTKGLEMLLDIAGNLPRFVWVDEVRLKQILVNLFSNAAKFTEKGEILLSVSVLHKESGRARIRFSVKDSGIGIKADKQAKIFEAFSQEDSSTTKKYGGTGLGLTISNKLLAMMDSRMQLESEVGKGSRFFFDVEFDTEEDETSYPDVIESVKNVLVVDDNDNNREILKRMLQLKNIACAEARNGIDALQRIGAGERFDVIMMDYNMPYMDGLETSRKIRELREVGGHQQNIVLLYSSSADTRIQQECVALDIQYRLAKPLRYSDIMQVLLRIDRREVRHHVELIQAVEAEARKIAQELHILIVEDNPVNMLLAKTIMKRIAPRSHVSEAPNGRVAVRMVAEQRPDIIFMDVQMPEMNGYEATRTIRGLKGTAGIPIIALTAGNIKGEKEKCLEAGMSDFVSKPVIEDTLAMTLKKWFATETGETQAPQVADTNTSRHFDRNTILAHVDENEELFQEIVLLTIDQLQQSIDDLEQYIAAVDLKSIRSLGHKIYGTAITSGLHMLSDIANELEYLPGFDAAQLKQIFERYVTEVETVLGLMTEEA
ncbi:MAG: PAS domain S-box protein [Mucilaginibacter polytrichastri]|nr:PAS domain S-box protein [Mucilaginibacter polytrichastri]